MTSQVQEVKPQRAPVEKKEFKPSFEEEYFENMHSRERSFLEAEREYYQHILITKDRE